MELTSILCSYHPSYASILSLCLSPHLFFFCHYLAIFHFHGFEWVSSIFYHSLLVISDAVRFLVQHLWSNSHSCPKLADLPAYPPSMLTPYLPEQPHASIVRSAQIFGKSYNWQRAVQKLSHTIQYLWTFSLVFPLLESLDFFKQVIYWAELLIELPNPYPSDAIVKNHPVIKDDLSKYLLAYITNSSYPNPATKTHIAVL